MVLKIITVANQSLKEREKNGLSMVACNSRNSFQPDSFGSSYVASCVAGTRRGYTSEQEKPTVSRAELRDKRTEGVSIYHSLLLKCGRTFKKYFLYIYNVLYTCFIYIIFPLKLFFMRIKLSIHAYPYTPNKTKEPYHENGL